MAEILGLTVEVDTETARLKLGQFGQQASRTAEQVQAAGTRMAAGTEASARRVNEQFGRIGAAPGLVNLRAQIGQTASTLAGLGGVAGSTASSIAGIAAAAGPLAGIVAAIVAVTTASRAAIRFLTESIDEALRAEESLQRLRFTLAATGSSYAALGEDLEEYFSRLQATTRYTDDQARDAFTQLALITGDAGAAQQLLGRAIDVSAGSTRDLETVTRAIAVAIETGTLAGKRYGLVLQGVTEEQLKNATETERAGLILQGFARYTGAAESAAGTLGGRLAITSNQWNELKEAVGGVVTDLINVVAPLDTIARGLVASQSAIRTIREELGPEGLFGLFGGPSTAIGLRLINIYLEGQVQNLERAAAAADAYSGKAAAMSAEQKKQLDALLKSSQTTFGSEGLAIIERQTKALNALSEAGFKPVGIRAAEIRQQIDLTRTAMAAGVLPAVEGRERLEELRRELEDLTPAYTAAREVGVVPLSRAFDDYNERLAQVNRLVESGIILETQATAAREAARAKLAEVVTPARIEPITAAPPPAFADFMPDAAAQEEQMREVALQLNLVRLDLETQYLDELHALRMTTAQGDQLEQIDAERQLLAEKLRIDEETLLVRHELEVAAARRRGQSIVEIEQRTALQTTALQQRASVAGARIAQMQAQAQIGGWMAVGQAASAAIQSTFGENKAGAIATTIINTSMAIMQALANIPPPYSYVVAGISAAIGNLQIHKILSTNIGGGGSVERPNAGGARRERRPPGGAREFNIPTGAATGGIVAGTEVGDVKPFLLSPGEAIIPRSVAQEIFGGRAAIIPAPDAVGPMAAQTAFPGGRALEREVVREVVREVSGGGRAPVEVVAGREPIELHYHDNRQVSAIDSRSFEQWASQPEQIGAFGRVIDQVERRFR